MNNDGNINVNATPQVSNPMPEVQPTPQVAAPTPVVEAQPAPQVVAPTPVVDAQPAPQVAPTPVVDAQPAPQVAAPTPVVVAQPAPQVAAPTPVVEAQPAPQVVAPAPAPAAEPVIASTSTVGVEMDSAISSNDTDVTDEELLKAFVGDSYENFINKKINLGALLFGGVYCFYRKMMIYGAVIVAIYAVLSLSKALFMIFGIIINVVCCIFANKYYLEFAKKRVQQIKEENRGMTRSQLIDACKQDGGVSVPYAIACPLAITIGLTIIKRFLFGA